GHAPVVDVLAAAHGVREVDAPVVPAIDVGQGRRDPALGHDRVRLAEQGLADQADRDPRGGRLDGRPQPGAAGAEDEHVVFVDFVIHRWPSVVGCMLHELQRLSGAWATALWDRIPISSEKATTGWESCPTDTCAPNANPARRTERRSSTPPRTCGR